MKFVDINYVRKKYKTSFVNTHQQKTKKFKDPVQNIYNKRTLTKGNRI